MSAARFWPRTIGMRLLMVAVLLAALIGGGCAELEHKERELTFRVVPSDASWFSGIPAAMQELDLPVGVDNSIHAWWWKAELRDAPTLLYLHGSRWNLTGQLYRLQQLHDFGFSILAIDYRGFGKSRGGEPSEKTVYEDAAVGWEELVKLQPDPAKRYIYGHSLGGAIAIDLAARLSEIAEQAHEPIPAHGLIVESTFTTLADIARALSYDWIPFQLIMSQKFDSLAKIANVRMPLLVVHGASDRYVPPRFSRALYDAATQPKRLLIVDGGSHNNAMRLGSDEYREALTALFGLNANVDDRAPASVQQAKVQHATHGD
ncbi:MAG TPA: alpha/beta fold hydrolase [Casimicrobiaceae bacterium]|nr:alpha/beta fold hydrolase [Casimicrobiaceae bacterium]